MLDFAFMKNLSRIFQGNKLKLMQERLQQYKTVLSEEERRKWQLDKFNEVWRDAWENVAFYSKWKITHHLPDRVSDLKELLSWPIVTKKDFQENPISYYGRNGVKPTGYMMTGGSTGEPLRLPTLPDDTSGVSMLIGRRAYGISLGDRWLFLWGHRHLYGYGIRRIIAMAKQSLKDRLQNRLRVSSYDLSEDAMLSAYDKMEKWVPDVFGGFSAAVLAFVRTNKAKGNGFMGRLKAVFCTAGPLSDDEQKEISSYFNGAPICLEYGSNDCGVMAYTRSEDSLYHVFWDTHLLQGLEDRNGEVKNIVTRLTHCYVPMIRFDIGDYLDLGRGQDGGLDSVFSFKAVKGRPSDIVRLKSGVSFFGALIGDCVKQISGVISSQTYIYDDERIEIRVVATRTLSSSEKDLIKRRFCEVANCADPHLVGVKEIKIGELKRTPAGKIPLIMKTQAKESIK